jgi:hypothetical protein
LSLSQAAADARAILAYNMHLTQAIVR